MQKIVRFFARHAVVFALGSLFTAFLLAAHEVDFASSVVAALPFLLIASVAAGMIALQNHYELQVAKGK